jgi:hypothetical protein
MAAYWQPGEFTICDFATQQLRRADVKHQVIHRSYSRFRLGTFTTLLKAKK